MVSPVLCPALSPNDSTLNTTQHNPGTTKTTVCMRYSVALCIGNIRQISLRLKSSLLFGSIHPFPRSESFQRLFLLFSCFLPLGFLHHRHNKPTEDLQARHCNPSSFGPSRKDGPEHSELRFPGDAADRRCVREPISSNAHKVVKSKSRERG